MFLEKFYKSCYIRILFFNEIVSFRREVEFESQRKGLRWSTVKRKESPY